MMKATRDENTHEVLDQQNETLDMILISRARSWQSSGLDVSSVALDYDQGQSSISIEDETKHHQSSEALIITVNRPQVRNALDLDAMRALAEIVSAVQTSPVIPAAIILTGAGKSFVAGGDLKALHGAQSSAVAQEMSQVMCDAFAVLRSLSCPFIIAAEGHAVGGGAELLLAGDIRVIAEDAKVRFAQVSLGLCTGWGGAERLADLMGRQRALALMLSGATLDAEACLSLGIASRISRSGQALQTALDWASQLALVPRAVAAVKQVLSSDSAKSNAQGQAGSTAHTSHLSILEREQAIFPQLWVGDEHWRAVERFWAKRRSSSKAQPETAQPETPFSLDHSSGMFIVLEGIDGAGTTTQAERIISWLQSRGRRAHFTCEPSDGTIGRMIRGALSGQLLGHSDSLLPAESLALLFAADRADHWHNEIEPLMRQGVDVICDRYLYSSLAYQGLELDEEWVMSLNSRFPRPDLLLFVQVSPEVAASRRDERGLSPDRYEVNELQIEIARRYERICDQGQALFIDGDRAIDEVSADCFSALQSLLSQADFTDQK